MKYRSIRLCTKDKIPLSLSNSFEKPYLLEDAVEDSKTAEELLYRMMVVVPNYLQDATIDRTTEEYIRYKLIDAFNNVDFLYIYF